MWPAQVKKRLADLAKLDPNREFIWCDSYSLLPPIEEVVFEQAERMLGFELPPQYRVFLREIGNGGAGPGDGVIPFDLNEIGLESARKPFAFLASYTEEGLSQDELNRNWELSKNGLIPIADYGCGQCACLILNGQFRGEVWIADWAVDAGVQKFGNYAQLHDRRLESEDIGYDFSEWYDSWLDGIEFRFNNHEKLNK